MSETLERTDDLIDHEMLRRWQSDHDAAAERLSAARQALAKAQGEHTAATHASERAAANGDINDAHLTQLALEASARGLTVAERVFASASAAMSRSNERRQTVAGLAHVPVYESCMRTWKAEVEGLEADVAAVAARRARIEANFVRFRQCIAAGCPDLHQLTAGPTYPETVRDLRAHFEGRQIAWDNPKHGWRPE